MPSDYKADRIASAAPIVALINPIVGGMLAAWGGLSSALRGDGLCRINGEVVDCVSKPDLPDLIRRLQNAVPSSAPIVDPISSEPYSSSGASGGGVPVSIFTQLGSALMQQSAAVRQNAAKAAGRKGGRASARKRKKSKAAAPRAAKRARKSKSRGRLKKGSPAAKAWGRKMKAARRK